MRETGGPETEEENVPASWPREGGKLANWFGHSKRSRAKAYGNGHKKGVFGQKKKNLNLEG